MSGATLRHHYSSFRSDSAVYVLAALLLLLSLPLSVFAGQYQIFVPILGAGMAGGLVLLLRPKLALFVLLIIWPIYPTALRMLGLENVTISRLWPEALLIGTVAGQAVAWLVARRPLRVRPRLGDLLVVLVFAGGIYAAVLAPSVEALVYGFRLSYEPILFYFVVRLLPVHVGELKRWLIWFVAGAAILGGIGFYFELTGPSRFYSALVPPDLIPALWRMGDWRMSSLLLNPLYFGPVVAMAGIFCFAWFLSYRSWWALLFFGFFAACVWFSITRSAYIMLAIGVTTVLIFWSLRSYSMMILSATAFLLLLVGAMALVLGGGDFSLLDDGTGTVFSSRFPQVTRTVESFVRAPMGYGLGLGHASRKFDVNTLAVYVYDGWYFKVLLEGGIAGALLFALFVLGAPLYLIAKIRHATARFAWSWHLCVLAILLGAAVIALVTNVWEHYMVAGVLWMLFGFSTSLNGDNSMTALITIVPKARPLPVPAAGAVPAP